MPPLDLVSPFMMLSFRSVFTFYCHKTVSSETVPSGTDWLLAWRLDFFDCEWGVSQGCCCHSNGLVMRWAQKMRHDFAGFLVHNPEQAAGHLV